MNRIPISVMVYKKVAVKRASQPSGVVPLLICKGYM
jgi:hypothetical protein